MAKLSVTRDNPPSAAAEASVGPISIVVVVKIRHYCCCVSKEVVLDVTQTARWGARVSPDRESRLFSPIKLKKTYK